jgi:hypothetical protein
MSGRLEGRQRCLIAIGMFALLVTSSHPMAAQDAGKPIVIGHTVTLRSKILNEDRRINIDLPERYQFDPTARYPVMYQLDGEVPGR